MKLLLVEDNINIAEALEYSFKQNNFELINSKTIDETKDILNKEYFSLIILDVTLPDGNGLKFYEDYLKQLNIPVIFLTACDDENDIVKALNIGAEDYITKPFSTKELLARINKVLLRQKKNTIIKSGNISFDIDSMIVKRNADEINLTSLELKILYLLFININKVVRRDVIIDKIWEWTGNDVNDNTVTVYLKRIRCKLQSDIIKTIKGIGYRIDEE